MPSVNRPPSARERIGGRWAVSLRLWVIGCVFTALIQVTDSSGIVADPAGDAARDALVLLAQCAVLGAVLLLADRTVLRRRREHPVPIWLVFVVSALAGAARLLPDALLTPGARLVTETAPPLVAALVIASTVAATSMIAPALAYLFATRDWYTAERARLLALEVEVEAQRLRAIGALDAVRDIAVRTADERVRDAQAAASATLEATDDRLAAADALLDVARDRVRPIGHALAAAPGGETPASIPLRRVIDDFLRRRPLPIAIPLIALLALATPRYAANAGTRGTLLAIPLTALGVLIVFMAARLILRQLPSLAIPITTLACLIAPLPAALAIGAATGTPSFVPTLVLIAVPLFLITFATALTQTASDSAEQLLAALREPLAEAELERLAVERARSDLERELGLQVHASVQSGLVAASYALQDAIARGDESAQDEALRSARSLLTQRIELRERGGAAVGGVALREAVAREWGSLIDVDWIVEPPDAADRGDVLRLVRESLSNAIIHGRATRARIRIEEADGGLAIEVADDGDGPGRGERGLGASILDDVCAGDWSLNEGPEGGAIIRARVPLNRPG